MTNPSNSRRSESYGTIEVIPRKVFLREWDYSSGQHLTMLGPTQRGKTTLALELLQRSISEDLKATLLAGKPPGRDPTMNAAADMLNLRIVDAWPPAFKAIEDRRKPNRGYVLRPHHTMTDPEKDDETLKYQFGRALRGNYASQENVITFADEAYHVQVELGLRKECEAILSRGAPVSALWSLLQRGRFVSYLTYNSPEHIFIAFDPDISNQKRYSEIGGVDPGFVMRVAATLQTKTIQPRGNTISEFLYIRRSGSHMCIVDMQ